MPENIAAAAGKSDPVSRGLMQAVHSMATLPQRALGASEMMRQTGIYNPEPIVEAAMIPMGTGAIAGVPMRAGEAVLGAGPIRAYHGSPHDFDRFDLSKIGTGEGAHAYGHGLYFADKESVAKAYRDKLSAGNDTSAYPGRMYEVNINADPAHFLDWDKPLSQQSELVRNTVQPYIDKDLQSLRHSRLSGQEINDLRDALENKTMTGREIYHRQMSLPKTTEELRAAGIPGIKYLDQGSRTAGEGSRNYVVFDDKLIDILRKYGLAGLAAPPVFSATMDSNRK